MRISDWSSDVCSSDLCTHEIELDRTEQMRNIRGVNERDRVQRAAFPEGSDDPQFSWYDRQRNHPAAVAWRDQPYGRSEEHTSELQSLMLISYSVFCLYKKFLSLFFFFFILFFF